MCRDMQTVLWQAGRRPQHLGAANRRWQAWGGQCHHLWHGPDLLGQTALPTQRPSLAWAWTRPGQLDCARTTRVSKSWTLGEGGKDKFHSEITTAGERGPRGDFSALQDRRQWYGLGPGAHGSETRTSRGWERGQECPRVFTMLAAPGSPTGQFWVGENVRLDGQRRFYNCRLSKLTILRGTLFSFGLQHAVSSPGNMEGCKERGSPSRGRP